MRKPLAENIVLLGGTAMTKGFKARLKQELTSLIKDAKYADKLFSSNFKFHSPPAKENYVAWLGGTYTYATNNYNYCYRIIRKSFVVLLKDLFVAPRI